MSAPRSEIKTALVVIPGRSQFWVLWCLDYAVILRQEGFHVDLLDLSAFSSAWYRKYLRKLLFALRFNNRLEVIAKKVCSDHGIRYIKPPESKIGNRSSLAPIVSFEKVAFLSLLDAQYAATLGRRITSEDLLPQETLDIETYFYQVARDMVASLCMKNHYEIVATANGRIVVSGAVKAAALESIGKCQILDTSVNGRWSYQVYKPDYLEDLEFIPLQIDELWQNAGLEKVQIAQKALEKKLKGFRLDAPTWTSAFSSSFDVSAEEGKKLAVIFPTSDWERPLHLMNDPRMTFGGDQQIAFATFSDAARLFGFKVIVRAHPHPGDSSREKIENSIWGRFCVENNLGFIASDSGIDSYDLMKKSNLNVSYVSSAAIDSIILNRPTLVLGRSEFSHLISDIFARDKSEILEILEESDLVVEKSRLYPWSYFQEKGQLSLQIIQLDTEGRVLYKGKEIEGIALKGLENSIIKLKELIQYLTRGKLIRGVN